MKGIAPASAFKLVGGRIEGRYRIKMVVALSQFTAQYLLSDETAGNEVAATFFHCISAPTATELTAFNDYCLKLLSLSHPALVKFLSYGVLEERIPYLIAEPHIDSTLTALIAHAWLEKDPAERFADAMRYGEQVCAALSYLHSQGIVVGSLTPSTIVIDQSSSNARIANPGIFKIIKIFSNSYDRQAAKYILGSPLYISPEQVLGQSESVQSDIYSLACVLYELLTGSPPHLDSTSYATAVAHVRRSASLKPLRIFPRQLSAVMKRALARDPACRFSNAADLSAGLRSVALTNFACDKVDRLTKLKRYTTFRKSGLLNPGDMQLIDRAEFLTIDRAADTHNQRLKATYLAIAGGSLVMYAVSLFMLLDLTDNRALNALKLAPLPINQEATHELPALMAGSLTWSLADYQAPCLMARETEGNWTLLSTLNDLELIDLCGSAIDDKGLSYLKHQPLKYVDLSACKNIHGAGIDPLKEIPSLRVCNFAASSLCDSDLDCLNPDLWVLNLSMCPITDAGVVKIARLKHLKVLRLRGTRISRESIGSLSSLKDLIYIDVRDCSAMPMRYALELQSQLPHAVVRVDAVLPGSGLSPMDQDSVTKLVEHSTKIAADGVAVAGRFNKLRKLSDLRQLALKASGITDKGMQTLKYMPLTYVEINECGMVGAHGIQALQHIPTLLIMSACNTSVKDRAMGYLNPNLVKLDLKGDFLHDQGVQKLANLRHLQMLRLDSAALTPKSFEYLRAIKTMKYIDLRGSSGITPDQAKALEKSIPGSTVLAGRSEQNAEF